MSSKMKIGMVGLDTSHCVAFARILHDETYEYHLPGAEIVAAYPGGSNLFSLSRDRVKGFTEQLVQDYGVRLYDSIADLAKDVDAIMLESVDGRQHLAQFKELAIGRPVFVDKPLAVSVADARAMVRLARETQTPLMSSSSLRYAAGIADLLAEGEEVVSCEAFGPAPILEDYPGLFWYGIHSAEVLFSLMGQGCRDVRTLSRADQDIVMGEWADGRVGILRGTRFAKNEFGAVLHTSLGAKCGLAQSTPPYYVLLLEKILQFFATGVSPIPIEETLEIIAFLEAADRSKAEPGPITLAAL